MFISSILIITTLLQGQQRQGIIVHAAKITLTQEIKVTTTIHVSPTTTSTSTWTLLLEGGSTLLPPLTALVPVSGPGTLATTTGISILGTYNDDDDDDDVVSPSSHHYYHQSQTQTSTLTRDSASYQPSSFSSSSTTNTPASTTATATSVIRKIWTSTRTVPVEVTSKVIIMPATAAASSRLHAGINSTRVGIGRNYTLATTTTSSAATTATKGIVLLGAPLAGQRNSTMTRSRTPWTSTTSSSSSSSGITASGSATTTAQSGASFGCEVDRRILVWWLMMAGVWLLLLVG